MSAPAILPAPPSAEQMTLAWFASPSGKAMLASYMQAVYAGQNRQYVLTVAGVRKPPVVAQSAGGTSIVELTVS